MTKRTGEETLQNRIDEEVQVRLSKLLDILRHELRTPIGSILTLSDLLNEQAAEAQRTSNHSDYVEAIRQSAETALNILQNLAFDPAGLGLSALAGAPLMHKTFNLPGFLASLEAHHKAGAETKGLQFHVRHGTNLPERIIAPMTSWRQVIDNLLSNAIKYTQKGTIGFSVEVEEDYLAFHVEDTGPGFLAAGGEKLFDAYERGNNKSTAHGQGLGLAIVKTLTSRCEGALSFKDNSGEGTHFYLRLPYQKASAAPRKKPKPPTRPHAGRNILVVEDNPVNRMLMETLLDKFGHRVTQASDGLAALKIAQKEHFDLVLMDIELPHGMNGFAVSDALRELPGWENVPILALSARDGPEVEEQVAEHGIQGFVSKPLSARALYTAIEGTARPAETGTGN